MRRAPGSVPWLLAALAGCGGAAGRAPGEALPPPPSAGLDPRPANPTCLAPPTPADVAPRLSRTGCFDPADPRRPAAGLIAYDVNAPLWSDGADKRRWLALPDGTRLRVAADGDLELPVGAVLAKAFSLAGREIETRLLVRHASGAWAGYSYAWAEDGRDAALIGEDGAFQPIGRQEWHFPSRQHCLDCHTRAAGFTLGLELAQLDRDRVDPGGRNQLATWVAMGLFETDLPPPAARPLPLADPDVAAAPLEARARAYLHANCGNCHRPDGVREPNVEIDLRVSTPLAGMRICDEIPRRTDLGVAEARLLAPGDPERSLLSIRLHTLVASVRMPPVASSVVDVAGAALVDGWILSLRACP